MMPLDEKKAGSEIGAAVSWVGWVAGSWGLLSLLLLIVPMPNLQRYVNTWLRTPLNKFQQVPLVPFAYPY